MEVELKLRLRDPQALERRLESLGCPLGPATIQRDTFFKFPDRDPAVTDEALRLREDGMVLTYKGPRQGEGIKRREEVNIRVLDDPRALLEQLGYQAVGVLTKSRRTARIGGCEVAVDHVEGLGWFCEIEALETGPADAAIEDVQQQLGLEGEPVTTSYLELAKAAKADAWSGP